MKKLALAAILLFLSSQVWSADLAGFAYDRDANKIPIGIWASIQGAEPAHVTATNSGYFTITSANYTLTVSVDGVEDTVNLRPGRWTVDQIISQIGYKLLNVYAKTVRDVNDYRLLQLFTPGDSHNIAVIAKSTGAETILGLSTTRAYSMSPRISITGSVSENVYANTPWYVVGGYTEYETSGVYKLDADNTSVGYIAIKGRVRQMLIVADGAAIDSFDICVATNGNTTSSNTWSLKYGGEHVSMPAMFMWVDPLVSFTKRGQSELTIRMDTWYIGH